MGIAYFWDGQDQCAGTPPPTKTGNKGPTVKLHNLPFSSEPVSESSVGDPLSSITLLVNCLEKARFEEATDPNHADAVDEAMSAALKVEKRLLEQSERIDYLERLAMTDELTGLLNRRGFINQLQHSLSTARRYDEKGVLIYVDLDGFKPINDTYGHAVGDQVLVHVAKVLMDNVRETDYVGRMGGDEFSVLLTRSTTRDGLKRAESIDEVLNNTPARWRGRRIPFRSSLGFLAYGPEDNGTDLLARVDNAMYKTKRTRAKFGQERASA